MVAKFAAKLTKECQVRNFLQLCNVDCGTLRSQICKSSTLETFLDFVHHWDANEIFYDVCSVLDYRSWTLKEFCQMYILRTIKVTFCQYLVIKVSFQ